MMDDIDEARDWRGDEIDCAACTHQDRASAGRCRLKHACVHDRYARRIDRFFNWNPNLANSYVAHPHFEVRWNAARRLPKRLVLRLRTDVHREVRIRIVSLLDDAELMPMMADADYYVRLVVARRVAPSLLASMIDDEEAEVRRVVAQRIPRDRLLRMTTDLDAGVRLEIAQRLTTDLLSRPRDDPVWRVRYEVASRIAVGEIAELAFDSDGLVQDMARSRATGRQERLGEFPA